MTTPRFLSFLPFIFKWECVKNRKGQVITEKDPDDPGGLTKYGIDKRSHPNLDITNLTEAQATEQYFKEWTEAQIEHLPPKLGEVFFNCRVNCGEGRAKALLVNNTAKGFIDAQEAFYRRLVQQKPSLQKFLKGWLNRTEDLRKYVSI